MTWSGGRFGAYGECLLAPNAGIMTLDGTNTWILREGERSLVVDPGPLAEEHLSAIVATATV